MSPRKHKYGAVNAGEDNPRAKLTEKDVLFIRDKRESCPDKWSLRRLASYFDVSVRAIRLIESGDTWNKI